MELDLVKIREIADKVAAVKNEIEEVEQYKSDVIAEIDRQLKSLKSKEYRITAGIKDMFPKEFWTCEIDQHYHMPLHYKIKSISCYSDEIYIITQDIRKKKPFDGWKGEDQLTLDRFIKIGLYNSYDNALYGYEHRPCPHCGDFMGNSSRIWCDKCLDEYRQYLKDNTRLFYDTKQRHVYGVKPDIDPILKPYFWIGFDGHYFKIRRTDTGEIIETHNLWQYDSEENNGYPPIEFLEYDICQ